VFFPPPEVFKYRIRWIKFLSCSSFSLFFFNEEKRKDGPCEKFSWKPSKWKWIEMDRNGFILFVSNPDSDLEFISIQLKFPNFLKSIRRDKNKAILILFNSKKICRPLIHFNPSRGIKTKWFLLFKSKKSYSVIQFILIHDIGLKWYVNAIFSIHILFKWIKMD